MPRWPVRPDDGLSYTQRNYRKNWPWRQVVLKRSTCKRDGIPFDLDEFDIQIPDVCPVLGIPLQINTQGHNKDNSPSIDKIKPELGYVKGNVAVISLKANRIKNNATAEELKKVYDWLTNINS